MIPAIHDTASRNHEDRYWDKSDPCGIPMAWWLSLIHICDNYAELRAHGYEVSGVSVKDAKSHQKFIEKNELPFTLIADTEMCIRDRCKRQFDKLHTRQSYHNWLRLHLAFYSDLHI